MTEQIEQTNIFWLSGSYYKRKELLDEIKSVIGSFSLFIYDENTSAEYVESQMHSGDLFSENKLFILQGFPSFGGNSTSDNKKLVELLKNISGNCYVVFDGISPTVRPALYKEVKKIGKVVECPHFLKRKEAVNWIANRVRELEKDIDPKSIEYILDRVGADANKKGIDVDKLYVSLKKIIQFIGKKSKEIKPEDVLAVLDEDKSFFLWNVEGLSEGKSLFEALDNKDLKQCYICVKNASIKKDLAYVAQEIFSVLMWRYRMLFFAKEASFGKEKNNIVEYIQNSLFKFEKDGTGNFQNYKQEKKDGVAVPVYSSGILGVAVKGFYGKSPLINYYSRENLYKILKCIGECFSKLRTEKISDQEIMLLFDSIFMTIIDIGLSSEELYWMREPTRVETI